MEALAVLFGLAYTGAVLWAADRFSLPPAAVVALILVPAGIIAALA